MSNFALDTSSPLGDIVGSLNYALANLGTFDANIVSNIANVVVTNANVVTANTTTGQLSSRLSGTISYLYNYVNVKYANSATGSSGFSSNCTSSNYYGTHNTTDGTISSNPTDYNWKQVTGGFGTTKGLYYTTAGGGQVYFAASSSPISSFYQPVLDNTPILLQSLANSLVQTYNINPGAVTNVSIAANTITADNVKPNTLTALQIADRTLSSAQIALQGITGNVIAQNTITGNLVALNTITGNLVVPGTITGNLIQANTITGNLVAANTIQGSSIVAGSITTVQLAADAITVNTVVSSGATINSYSSQGFWLNGNTGNARFGNTLSIGDNLFIGNSASIGNNLFIGSSASIGNNLIVGQNAQIGGNLQVTGLITTGALNANTVSTSTITLNSTTQIFTNSTATTSSSSSNPAAYPTTYAMGANVVIPNVNPSTSTFLITVQTSPWLFFSSGTGPGAPGEYGVGFSVSMRLPDGTVINGVSNWYELNVNWVNYFINMEYINSVQLSNWQTGPYTQTGTYEFWLNQWWTPSAASPYNPTLLQDQGRTLSIQQIKR